MTVQNLLPLSLPSVIIRDLTQEKGLMSAVNVENPSGIVHNSVSTGEVTLEKGLMSVVNVGNFLQENLHSLNIREFTLERSLRCAGNVQFPIHYNNTGGNSEEPSL